MSWQETAERLLELLGSGYSYRAIATVALVFALAVVRSILARFVRRQEKAGRLKHASALLAGKLVSLCVFVALVVGIALIWSAGLGGAWAAVTSVIGLVAIGFFAVWSILSNLVAGLMILLARPFYIDDHIDILPESISGRVYDLTLMFVVLKEEGGATVAVPNNIIFQRMVRRRPPEAE